MLAPSVPAAAARCNQSVLRLEARPDDVPDRPPTRRRVLPRWRGPREVPLPRDPRSQLTGHSPLRPVFQQHLVSNDVHLFHPEHPADSQDRRPASPVRSPGGPPFERRMDQLSNGASRVAGRGLVVVAGPHPGHSTRIDVTTDGSTVVALSVVSLNVFPSSLNVPVIGAGAFIVGGFRATDGRRVIVSPVISYVPH